MHTTKLSYGEIYQIILATLRSILRPNERITSSIAMMDRWCTLLNERGLESVDELWSHFFDGYFEFMAGASGENNVSPEKAEYVREGIIAEGSEDPGIVIADYIASKTGRIYYYPETMAYYVYTMQDEPPLEDRPQFSRMDGESVAHYARRWVYIAVGHERRHSCQSYADIAADVATIDPTKNQGEQYANLPTERDADAFGFFHASDPMGMYHDAY